MLNLYSDLRGFSIQASDGKKGVVDDIYFDDDSWILRYVVADIGPILFGRKALIGADLLGRPDISTRGWPVALGKEALESAPGPESAAPVSVQESQKTEARLQQWPSLLLGPAGAAYTPILAEQQLAELRQAQKRGSESKPLGDPHLRSMDEVTGYSVRARDDSFGTIDDFAVDPEKWQVDSVIVETGDWLPGKRVVLPVDRISHISWNRGEVAIDLDRDHIESARPADEVKKIERSEPEFAGAENWITPV